MFPQNNLDATGVRVSALGLGAAWLGRKSVSESAAVETVHMALDGGVNFIDTSPLYHYSEARIGLALKGGRRDHVFLCTKTGTHPDRKYDYSRDATRWSIENSLRMLRTDYLDAILVHDPSSAEQVFAPGAVLDTLEELRQQKILRRIGIGVRSHDILKQCVLSGRFDLILTFMDYNPVDQSASPLIQTAYDNGIAVLNGSPLAMGLLTGADPQQIASFRPGRWTATQEKRAVHIHEWCNKKGIDVRALSLQYSLSDSRIAVTLNGAAVPAEIGSSMACAAVALPESIWSDLERDLDIPMPERIATHAR